MYKSGRVRMCNYTFVCVCVCSCYLLKIQNSVFQYFNKNIFISITLFGTDFIFEITSEEISHKLIRNI